MVAAKFMENEELFKDDLAVDESGKANLSYLLGAAIVLDSYNFKEELRDKKWNFVDEDAHAFLSKTANLGFEYWAKLNSAKFDVQAGLQLGLRGIFVRDYKCYDLPAGLMGVSVTTGSVNTLMNHFGQDAFAAAIEAITQERDLGLFCIVSIENDNELCERYPTNFNN